MTVVKFCYGPNDSEQTINTGTCIHWHLHLLQIFAQSYSVISDYDTRLSSERNLSRTLGRVKLSLDLDVSTCLYPERPT